MSKVKTCRRSICEKIVNTPENRRKYGSQHGVTKYGFCSISCYGVELKRLNAAKSE